jgi:hypothetical protein
LLTEPLIAIPPKYNLLLKMSILNFKVSITMGIRKIPTNIP